MSGLSETEELERRSMGAKSFLELFTRVKVEFLDTKVDGKAKSMYQPTVWSKSKSTNGSSFDSIVITREWPAKPESSSQ